jgi:hypothetical protein
LYRVARCYGLDWHQLLQQEFGLTITQDRLDEAIPPDLLGWLEDRSGIAAADLRLMTFSGWVPWVFDSLNAERNALHQYIAGMSVLFPMDIVTREVGFERPVWFPQRPRTGRICRECAEQLPIRRLAWQLPLMLSCPLHGWLLESASIFPGHSFYCGAPVSVRANGEVRQMDTWTWEALTQGSVSLPYRRVNAAVWFRLLRAVIHEISAPLNHYRPHTSRIKTIWHGLGMGPRIGITGVWKPYEQLKEEQQDRVLTVAARAIAQASDPVHTGVAFGPMALLFQRPVAVRSDNALRSLDDSIKALIDEARHDPEIATQLRRMVLSGKSSLSAIESTNRLMSELGIHLFADQQSLPRPEVRSTSADSGARSHG